MFAIELRAAPIDSAIRESLQPSCTRFATTARSIGDHLDSALNGGIPKRTR
jgi:hypothetical protein